MYQNSNIILSCTITHHCVDTVSLLKRAEQTLCIAVHGAFEEDRVDHLPLTLHCCQANELRHLGSGAQLLCFDQPLKHSLNYREKCNVFPCLLTLRSDLLVSTLVFQTSWEQLVSGHSWLLGAGLCTPQCREYTLPLCFWSKQILYINFRAFSALVFFSFPYFILYDLNSICNKYEIVKKNS